LYKSTVFIDGADTYHVKVVISQRQIA